MTKTNRLIYFFISLIFFIFFDLYITDSIIHSMELLPSNPLFSLVFVQNEGAAFNLFDGFKIFLITFSGIASLGIIFYTAKNIMKLSLMNVFCASMLTSGILCNMFERIMFGYVRDFINLNFIDFPVFNISDIFINISVFVIVIIMIKNNYFKKNEDNN